MNIRQLQYFVDLSETLNFTKTAQNFYISQTAITKQIQCLEGDLDIPLFHRSKKSVSLTSILFPIFPDGIDFSRSSLYPVVLPIDNAWQTSLTVSNLLKLFIIVSFLFDVSSYLQVNGVIKFYF